MPLPDSAKITIGTPIVLANSADYSNNQGFGARTDQIALSGVVAGAYQQSDKIDFGANIDVEYLLGASIEFATDPVAGEVVNFYMGWSASATPGVNNPGGLTGSGSPYTGYSSNADGSAKQLDFLGSVVLTVQSTSTVQIDTAIASFTPLMRYGTLVVQNDSAADNFHSDSVEMAVSMTPKVFQIQD